ncbi:MAG: hypothetical protein OXI35_04260 [Gemmatimonadota bacterium]|nr:hypothetical protein [Gemmatimonadota bacterium]
MVLRVEQHVFDTFKRAVRYTGLSQSGWVRLIVETLLEDDPTARDRELRRWMPYAPPVARGASSIHVRLPVPLWVKAQQRAAQEGQQLTPWLRRVCHQASVFADKWHPTETVERLKLGYAFLLAHDRHDEARTLKERAFLPRRDVLRRVVYRLEDEHSRRGFSGRLKDERPKRDLRGMLVRLDEQAQRQRAERQRLEQQIDDLRAEWTRVGGPYSSKADYELEELNDVFEPYSLLEESDPSPADETQYLADILAYHKVDACPLDQISAASLKEKPCWKEFMPSAPPGGW